MMAEKIPVMKQLLAQFSRKDSKKTAIPQDVQNELNDFIDLCKKHLKQVNTKEITRAFMMSYEAHQNKTRKSGEAYYKHPLEVARIVAKLLPLDETTVIAALLHDIPVASDIYDLKDINSEFGSTVAEIVDSVSKIHSIEAQNISHIENYRKLLVSLFKDLRIILIKIADRMHNMQTLDYLDSERQKRIARETLEIYAPFAHRFGLGRVKWELEDLAFKHLNRQAYNEISTAINLTREEREAFIETFVKKIKDAISSDPIFKSNGVKSEVKGRPKHIYSIFNKMIIREKPMNELYDLFAIRIIVESDDPKYCFLAYSIMSKIYKQVPDTYKDYITEPKNNGYQSIHVAFLSDDNKPVEVQIRTRKMHEVAEKGVAAHFKYKRGLLPAQSVLENENLENWFEKIRTIFENPSMEISDELLEEARTALLIDEIYVFTPTDEFRVMPKNSTPLDFAYAIHSQLGNNCIGAKVNGRVMPLNYKLNSGDRIEILTSKKQRPVNEWLKYVVTTKAKTVIQKYLKEEHKKFLVEGKVLWEQQLKNFHIGFNSKGMVPPFQSLGFSSEEDFFIALKKNEIDNSYLKTVLSRMGDSQSKSSKKAKEKDNEYLEKYSTVYYANCCYPLRGDSIKGIIGDGKSITVHRSECKKLKDKHSTSDSNIIEIGWQSLAGNEFTSKLMVTGEDKSGLLNEITAKLLNFSDIAVKSFHFDTKESRFFGNFTLTVKSKQQVNDVMALIMDIEGVLGVDRIIE